jgi:hypothetical protein
VANGARVTPPRDEDGAHFVLVDHGAIATCAEPLHALLSFARAPQPKGAVVDEARRLGADDDAAELVDDLVKDGLLAVV